jgi:predicted Holliday junction resolvase-like endonuclease
MNELLETIQAGRQILVVCPCCGELKRLSDLKLKYKGPAPKTWLDKYDGKIRLLESKETAFDEKEQEIRERSRERGRAKVDKMIRQTLEGGLAALKYNPYDIKAFLHPIDFLAFKGMNDGDDVEIDFLCRKTKNDGLVKTQIRIEETIKKQRYEWKTARIDVRGRIEYE